MKTTLLKSVALIGIRQSGREQPHSKSFATGSPFELPTGFGVRLSSAAFSIALSTRVTLNRIRTTAALPEFSTNA
jgi:hypothetical protein